MQTLQGSMGSSSDDDVEWGGSSSRLRQQMQTLKSLVPDMGAEEDERSILEGAYEYLQQIERESEQIQMELEREDGRGQTSSPSSRENHGPRILQVEAQKVTEGIFAVKMWWRLSESGGAALVQRVLESLQCELTSTAIYQMAPSQMLTTAFLKVKENRTEEELQDLIMAAASKSSLL